MSSELLAFVTAALLSVVTYLFGRARSKSDHDLAQRTVRYEEVKQAYIEELATYEEDFFNATWWPDGRDIPKHWLLSRAKMRLLASDDVLGKADDLSSMLSQWRRAKGADEEKSIRDDFNEALHDLGESMRSHLDSLKP
jgi:hypothetical protein